MEQILKEMPQLSRRYRDQAASVKFGINLIAGHWIGQIPIHARQRDKDKWVEIIEGWLVRCCGCDEHDLEPIRQLIKSKLG